MKESIVALRTPDGPMDLHCFLPDGTSGRLPAVIILQEAFGVNEHIKRVARRVAALGYATFAPELFHRSGKGLQFGYDEFPKLKPVLAGLSNDQVLEDLKAAFHHVSTRPDIDPTHIATWGFCFGGWASVLAGCSLPLAAAISFYGGGLVNARPGFGITPLVGRLESAQCPLLLVFGGKDAGIPAEDRAALEARLKALGKPYELKVYPDGGHGFFCEDRPAYHASSAESAWSDATAWLREKLG